MAQQQRATAKFHGEQHVRHNGKLHWPGINGIPFRGEAIPLLRTKEIPLCPLVLDAHEMSFDLSNVGHMEHYNWVRDRIRAGWFIQDRIHLEYPDIGNRKVVVYLEWSQLYYQAPPKKDRNNEQGRSNFNLRDADAAAA